MDDGGLLDLKGNVGVAMLAIWWWPAGSNPF